MIRVELIVHFSFEDVADLPTRGELEMAMASRTDRVETAEQPEMNSEDIVCD